MILIQVYLITLRDYLNNCSPKTPNSLFRRLVIQYTNWPELALKFRFNLTIYKKQKGRMKMESPQQDINLEHQAPLKSDSTDVDKLIDNIKTVATEKHDTLWGKLKKQLKDIGKTFLASAIALIVAIVSSFIFNSQYFQNIQIAVDDIRQKLPTEADKILVAKLSSTLGENSSLLGELQQEQLRQKEKTQVDEISNATYKQQLEEISKEFVTIKKKYDQQIVLNEKNNQQLELLNTKLTRFRSTLLTTSHPTNNALVKTLKQLLQQGKTMNSTKSPEENTQNWLRSVYYFVHTLPNGDNQQQLTTIKKAMTRIIDDTNEYKDNDIRISETLIILSTLKSLAEAAVLGTIISNR